MAEDTLTVTAEVIHPLFDSAPPDAEHASSGAEKSSPSVDIAITISGGSSSERHSIRAGVIRFTRELLDVKWPNDPDDEGILHISDVKAMSANRLTWKYMQLRSEEEKLLIQFSAISSTDKTVPGDDELQVLAEKIEAAIKNELELMKQNQPSKLKGPLPRYR